jgi:dTDP-glucose 4,6-dehydratase
MNPSTPYAISHMATDLSILSMHKHLSFPASIGRFANFYGAHQQLYRIVPKTIISILNNDIFDLHGGGKSVRAFVHSEDVSRGIMKIIDDGKAGNVYHFSPNNFYTIKELVMLICDELNADFEKHIRIAPDRTGKDYAYLMSSRKSNKELKWQCNIGIKDGINQTIRWVKDNLEEINRLSHDYIHKE